MEPQDSELRNPHNMAKVMRGKRRRIRGIASLSVLLGLSSIGVVFIYEKTQASDELQTYTETLPKSAVKIVMIPIPAGKLGDGTGAIDIKPFWIAQTETTWEAYDTFLTSGPASKAYDQTEFPADAIARPSKSYILPDLGWGTLAIQP